MSYVDLLLLHPPSIYDFRQRTVFYGPISDLIPSSPLFEMYPLGFLTMTAYLENRGVSVRVVNLALRMMNDRQFDVPSFLEGLEPGAIGIDLHWLPHAQGAIEIAKIVKELHPHIPIIFGGLSATYFHEELIQYPAVDMVLRGSSIEPPLYQLLNCLRGNQSLAQVPNLTWKEGARVRINPFCFVPDNLDYADLEPERMVRMVLRHRDLQSVLPFNGWWRNPITAVFTVRGCAHACVTCGNSQPACSLLNKHRRPLFRSPEKLVQNMRQISQISRGPIFLVGDLLQAGENHAQQVLILLRQQNLKNEIVFEFFELPPLTFLKAIASSVQNWSIELSPESHDQQTRRFQDETTAYTNEEMEGVIAEAMRLGCNRVDVFFMIGLPRQDRQSVMRTIEYCEHLFKVSDARLSCFISPLGPFLDPGSLGFEHPEQNGYRLFARTLEQHRQLLLQDSWQDMLNYETRWMSRAELVDATYDAGEALNRLKIEYGRIDPARGQEVEERIRQARVLKRRLEKVWVGEAALDENVRSELQKDIFSYSISTVCDKQELFWSRRLINFNIWGILQVALSHLGDGLRQVLSNAFMAHRKIGSQDAVN